MPAFTSVNFHDALRANGMEPQLHLTKGASHPLNWYQSALYNPLVFFGLGACVWRPTISISPSA